MMERLTTRNFKNNMAYLKKVKPNEQEVDSPYPNTLLCITESFQSLAAYEDTGLTPEEIKQLQAENERLKAELEKTQNRVEYVHSMDGQGFNW